MEVPWTQSKWYEFAWSAFSDNSHSRRMKLHSGTLTHTTACLVCIRLHFFFFFWKDVCFGNMIWCRCVHVGCTLYTVCYVHATLLIKGYWKQSFLLCPSHHFLLDTQPIKIPKSDSNFALTSWLHILLQWTHYRSLNNSINTMWSIT